ncbi:class I SAM-dependent RNA methyltransferase [Listeria booriae]|uniref:Class I SAM-dependent RNA methyltransferase n=1 Tax=Listeria booriae TaxID=1552123 RepID=A0A7X1C011_9LIST|nr:class I SAM-dependent RNA methyltransferase [Listeria booriae]MBC1357290.1 class I SAM-dependent RNA methyltransferase [Listeria booriae]MBC1373033.1 class I SAM-dependent RNA methyltransferase [Listeria booriae]MBC2364584.1 class I SAM-dependent RNA methyltransferase [Listeria booriae]MBC6299731.1 class I SAM-dependent RNA methyltransferase [Listeria booriae]
MREFQLVATAAAGLEAIVAKEVRRLGYECEVDNGKVYFKGDELAIARTNLWLRVADRVKIVVGRFKATTFDELFEKTKALPWEDLLPLDANFPVAGKSVKSTLFSVPNCQAITKKAIVSRLSEKYRRQGRLMESGALFKLEVSLLKDEVTITLDTSGAGLHKRGYRVGQGGAPLKETMAAALVLLTSWHPDRPFYDPVCGSGTIPIEAALIGRNIAPGLRRNFVCETWDWMLADVWEKARQEAEEAANYEQPLDILGTDIDHRMIEISKQNAFEAGLEDVIEFKQMQVVDFTTEKEYGVIVANPPYGERLEDEESVRELYREMRSVYRNMPTWSVYVLTSYEMFEEVYAKRATKKRKLYNGYLRTDLYQYWGPRPPRRD